MAKIPANNQQNVDPLSAMSSPIPDIKKQIAEISALMDKAVDETLKKKYRQELADLNDRLAVERSRQNDIIAEVQSYRKTQTEITDKEIADRRATIEKAAIDEVNTLRKAGIEEADKYEAQLKIKAAQDDAKNRLKEGIKVLEELSKESQKERDKEIEHLTHRKKLLESQNAAAAAKDKYKEVKKYKNASKEDKKKAKTDAKDAKKQAKKDKKQVNKDTGNTLGGGIKAGLAEQFKELTAEIKDGNAVSKTAQENTQKVMKGVGKAITAGLGAINDSITSYAKHQTAINSRLAGLKEGPDSYSAIAKSLNSIAFSPLLSAEDLYNNVAEIVGQGIAVNVEQRAMFATIKDGIAATFDVTSDSLKRIIRLQQNDSTAARLGLEAYLNEFLNVYTRNTEYLQDTFDTVASSLLEASALMKYNNKDNGVAESLEFEFQVQKWLGTLTGYGFSDEASQNIANAIGQLATGDVESLTNSDINNLLLMAANKGGVSYADMLSNGATADDINNLMYGVVSYMQEIAENNNNIIKNQLAKTFGIGITDLIAATNIQTGVLQDLHNESLSYEGMYGQLQESFDALPSRLGIANILENAFANLTYQTGANIAKNPALYALWKVTDMIQGNTGGIAIPAITAMGSGFDLEATVENLMKMGIAGVSLLGNIGSIIGGVATATNGSMLLDRVGVDASGATIKQIEGGLSKTNKKGKRESGDSASGGAVVGNSDSQTYNDAAVNDASDEAQKKVDAAKEKEEDPVVKYLKEDVKFTDKLDLIAASAAAIAATNLVVDASIKNLGYNVSAIEANIRTYYSSLGLSSIVSAEKFIDQNSKASASDAIDSNLSSINIGMTSVAGVSVDDLNAELSPIIQLLSEIKASALDLAENMTKASEQQVAISQSNAQTVLNSVTSSSLASNASNSSNNFEVVSSDSLIEVINDAAVTIKSAIEELIANIDDSVATPTGETSILSSSNNINNDMVNELSENILYANNSNVATSGYLSSEQFASEFQSIVQNVAKIAGDRTVKEWNNPASASASGSYGNSGNSYSDDGTIDGLTQYNTGHNPLLF